MEYTARMNEHALVSRAAAAGSCVLLKNVAHTLPFAPENEEPVCVAVFGIGQIFTPTGLSGMEPWRKIGILDGLSAASDAVQPDKLLAHKYRAWALEHPEGSEMPLGNLSMEEFASANDAAVIVLSRTAAHYDPKLTNFEQDMLKKVTGAFTRVVLVLAAPGYMELTETARSCGAIVFLGLAGQEAGYALADLLTGKVCPSGKLSFSWPEKLESFGLAAQQYDSFLGYRYFDTFGGDVLYPFGYGLGYGKAELAAISVGLDGCDVTVSADVENTGETYAVQETVQVYVSRPDSGKTGPAWFLDAFSKTQVLAPGEKQTLHLRFPVTDLALFREAASAYVLEEGFYDIRVGTSSRATCLAGSIKLTRSAVVQAVTPCAFPDAELPARKEPVSLYTYPEEAEERELARRRAIRLSDRNLPRRSRKKGRPFTGCRGDNERHQFSEVTSGACSAFTFIAGMDDANLRRLVCDFGFCPTEVPGAIGASAELPRYGMEAYTIASGVCGLALKKDIEQDDGTVQHQYTTGFPAPSLLSCSFDPDLIFSVGKAIGREMREYGVAFCLAPGCALQRTPFDAVSQESWSEDPVLTGACALNFAEGVQTSAAAILRTGTLPRSIEIRIGSFRDIYGLPFSIAAGTYKAVLLPDSTVNGESLGEDSDLIRSFLVDWKFGGMFLSDGERYCQEPDRVTLERSALRIVRVLTKK